DGMGNLRITEKGLKLEGPSEFLQPLYAKEIQSKPSCPLVSLLVTELWCLQAVCVSRRSSFLQEAWMSPASARIWTPLGASMIRDRVGDSSLDTQEDHSCDITESDVTAGGEEKERRGEERRGEERREERGGGGSALTCGVSIELLKTAPSAPEIT
ncbi:hypothetical protein CRUP_032692, partial [Coryphaenoides rupestris]